jgi:capsular exopolysaccharide synthesis family protein
MTTQTILDDPASLHGVREPEDPSRAQAEPGTTARDAVSPDIDEHLIAVHSPQSFEADQYRILRHFLDQHSGGAKRQVLGVTSPTAGDGKTTTAVNLAVTLAQSPGARVVLIDADLRRPFVAHSLGLDEHRGPGLAATALDPKLELPQLVRRTPFNVDVVPAGPSTPSAYRLFDSARVGQLLDQARGRYDHVVVDTPPVLLVPDCRLMSQWVDGFIVVVAAHRTPRKLLADGLSALDEEKLLGIVFNADDRPLSGYFGRYEGYYGYHQRQGEGGGGNRWRWPWRRAPRGRKQGWW